MALFRNTYAEIDINAYKHNLNVLSANCQSAEVVAVVKADAYGHGAVKISKAALEAGAAMLAVAFPEEALELREAGIVAPIMVLGCSNNKQLELAAEIDAIQCVFDINDICILQFVAAKLNKKARVYIKIDTGMNRIGLRDIDEFAEALDKITDSPNVELVGLFTHLARADETDKSFSHEQNLKFLAFAGKAREKGFSPKLQIANSAAAIDLNDYAYDFIRCGISSYGYYPSEYVDKYRVKLKPVMKVYAEISQIKKVAPGTPIGYNSTYITARDTTIATVQIGYGDGYPRLLSGKGKMLVPCKGGFTYANVLGRVCMDMTMIDVTGVDGVRRGDKVIVLGEEGGCRFNADDIATICGTISYEILLSFSKRVPRVYLK